MNRKNIILFRIRWQPFIDFNSFQHLKLLLFPSLFMIIFFCPALTKLAMDLYVNLCLFVCLYYICSLLCISGLCFKVSDWMIWWYIRFWHPAYPTRCFEPAMHEHGWGMPVLHSWVFDRTQKRTQKMKTNSNIIPTSK